MSCPCEKQSACPCDEIVHPRPLAIAAGLESIPRQIAAFPQFRAAMLASVWTKNPFAFWRARVGDDLGLMLVEMWAYVCDVLAFYDETIAHEVYLRTARRRPSLRRLVGLLGYVPRPAVAASVKLALLADGRQAVSLPRGTAFRSGAFDTQSPQVFELDADATIHPLADRFTLAYPRPTTVSASASTLVLRSGSASLKAGDPLLVEVQGQSTATQVGVVSSAATSPGKDGETYLQVSFASTLTFPANTSLASVRLSYPAQKASLWSSPATTNAQVLQTGTYLTVVLDGAYRQIKPGDTVILSRGADYRHFTVVTPREKSMAVAAGGPVNTLDKNGNTVSVVTPPVSALATELTLSGQASSWSASDAPLILVHYGLTSTGQVTAEARTSLSATDTLQAGDPLEQPTGFTSPTRFLLEDKNGSGVEVGASLSWSTGALSLDQGATWTPNLACPVEAYGNVAGASRGETVQNEILGSGDASQANQSFKLKKKPLTYKSAPTSDNERGVASTLQVYVNGVRWTEVASFYGVLADAQVYLVRQNDDGESIVIFGDGQRGARLPTGTSNVLATYRFGAGEATPPAGSITQLGKPVKGLKSVRNPVAASGGADAETAQYLQTYAPRSALLLGRAVSIRDMEAAAAGAPGVRAVSAEWAWNATQQRAVVQIWYIGTASAETLLDTLQRLSDPSTPIAVTPATFLPSYLTLDLEVDERHVVNDVLAAVRAKLMDKTTGILAPGQIGIGRPLYRSLIFGTVLAVAGTVAVQGIQWNSAPFTSFALSPGAGHYFDLEKGALQLSGKVASHA